MRAYKIKGGVQAIDPPYPGNLLKIGSHSSEVARMQKYLNAVKDHSGAVAALKIDGVFGIETKHAVAEFQARCSLNMDGIVGRQTWNRIVLKFNSISGGGQHVWPGIDLKAGSTGCDVKYMQEIVNSILHRYLGRPGIIVDGIYGANTAKTVRLFQALFGEQIDGIIDRTTWEQIIHIGNFLYGIPIPVTLAFPGQMGVGLDSDDVIIAQSLLNRIRVSGGHSWPELRVDGIVGEDTKAATAEFQIMTKNKPDGIVGSETFSTLVAAFNETLKNPQIVSRNN